MKNPISGLVQIHINIISNVLIWNILVLKETNMIFFVRIGQPNITSSECYTSKQVYFTLIHLKFSFK